MQATTLSLNWDWSSLPVAGGSTYLLDAPRDVRPERVRQRNREKEPTYARDVSDAFFERASDYREPINEVERERYDVRAIV